MRGKDGAKRRTGPAGREPTEWEASAPRAERSERRISLSALAGFLPEGRASARRALCADVASP